MRLTDGSVAASLTGRPVDAQLIHRGLGKIAVTPAALRPPQELQLFAFVAAREQRGADGVIADRRPGFAGARDVVLVQRGDRFGKLGRALIFQIVASNRSHDDVLHAHPLGGKRHVQGLKRINLFSSAGVDRTETATPSASISKNHERCCFFVPAFGQVGAPSAFTDRVEVLRPHQLLHVLDRVRPRQSDGQPFRQLLVHFTLLYF